MERQEVIPLDEFAGVAVDAHIEDQGVDDMMANTLRQSAQVLNHPDLYDPSQVQNARAFLTASIGFGRQASQDNVRRMNRPTRSGK